MLVMQGNCGPRKVRSVVVNPTRSVSRGLVGSGTIYCCAVYSSSRRTAPGGCCRIRTSRSVNPSENDGRGPRCPKVSVGYVLVEVSRLLFGRRGRGFADAARWWIFGVYDHSIMVVV